MKTREELIGRKMYHKDYDPKRYYKLNASIIDESKINISWNKEQSFNDTSNVDYSVEIINQNIKNGTWILIEDEEKLLTTIL